MAADKEFVVKVQYDTKDAVKAIDTLSKSIIAQQGNLKDLKDKLDNGKISQVDYATAVAEQTHAMNRDMQERKKYINVIQAEEGSIKRAKAENQVLREERNKMVTVYGKNSKAADELNKKIDANTKVINGNVDAQSKWYLGVKNGLDKLPFGNAISGFMGMAKAAMAFIATPIGAIIAAVAGAVGLLVKAFKTFEPIVEWVEQKVAAVGAVFTVLKEGIIGLVTGQKTLNETFKGTGEQMKNAANEAIRLKKAEQELEDQSIAMIANQAKYNRQIDELLLKSKNRTLSEKERIAFIDEALAVEEKAYNERAKIAEGEYKQALGKITNGRNFTKAEIENIDKLGIEYLQSFQKNKGIQDEEVKVFAEAMAKREQVLNESVSIREKAMNRLDVLTEKEEAKAAEAAAKAAEAAKVKAEADAAALAMQEARIANDAIINGNQLERIELTAIEQEAAESALDTMLKTTETELQAIEDKLKAEEEAAEREIEITKLKEEAKAAVVQAAQQIASDQFNAVIDNNLAKFQSAQQAEADILKNKLDKGLIDEQTYAKKMAALDLKTRQEEAKAEKKKALFSMAMDTAIAVAKTFVQFGGWPGGIAPAAIMAGIGAANASVILAKPIPKFFKGGTAPGGAAIIGDKPGAKGQHEYVMLPNGEGFISPAIPTLVDLPRGSKIFPEHTPETQAAMRGSDESIKYLKSINRKLSVHGGQPLLTEKGYEKINRNNNARTILLKRRFK